MRNEYRGEVTLAQPLHFGVPPSLGALQATTAASKLGSLLRRILAPEFAVTMTVLENYAGLGEGLLTGKLDVAWAPALVCAKVEQASGRALLRLSRGGKETYRSAFISLVDHPVDLRNLVAQRVAWVDRESTAGYLVPRRYLTDAGVDLEKAFKLESFAGSYNEAVVALIAGKADLSVTFASAAGSLTPSSGLDHLPASMHALLKIIGYTHETPNDGIVASPQLDPKIAALVTTRLNALYEDPASRKVLHEVFDADRLVVAPPGSYAALYPLVVPVSSPR